MRFGCRWTAKDAPPRERDRPSAWVESRHARFGGYDVSCRCGDFAGLLRFRSEARSRSSLKRYFHKGTPAGEPGMRFKMIGYGESFYRATTGENVEWPVVGVALQKNYISVYFAVTKRGAAVTDPYAGRLGELRMAATISVSKGSTIWIRPLQQPCSARPRKFSRPTQRNRGRHLTSLRHFSSLALRWR